MIEEITITSLSGRGSVRMKARDFQGYWLGPVDWGQVQGNHQTYSYYNQVGESIVSTSVLPRSLSITGWVIDDKAVPLQKRCDFLNAFISPVEDYMLEYNGRKIQFRPDLSVIYSPEYRKNNQKIRRFLIQATCPYPLFSDREDTVTAFDFSQKLFRFPTDFGRRAPLVFASTSKAYSVVIRNPGGFSTGLTARIDFSSPVHNPRLCAADGRFIGVSRVFQSGERLEICTTPGSKRMTLLTAEGGRENLIKYRDYRTAWIQLEPGENRLSLDCDEPDERAYMDAVICFTPLYLEVQ